MLARLALAAAVIALAAPVAAGEFTGEGDFHWTFAGSSAQNGDHFAVIGKVAGYTHQPGADPAVQFLATECLGWAIPPAIHGGSCVNHAANGDTYWVDYSCPEPVAPPAGGLFACNGKAVVKGGTGMFAKIAGENTYLEVTTGILPDGTMVGYTHVTSSAITY